MPDCLFVCEIDCLTALSNVRYVCVRFDVFEQ